MKPDEFKVGQRVRVVTRIEIYPLGIYPVGLTGTVVRAEPYCEMAPICAEVKLDGLHPELREWDGLLHVVDSDWEACTPDCWELVED